MKLFLLNILLLFTAAHTQWNNIPQFYSRDIYSIYFDNNNIYAGGDSLFFRSSDNGVTWESVAITTKSVSINDIIKIDNILYVGTYGEGVYRSFDEGYSWQQMNSGLSYASKYINLFYYSNNQLYVATDGGGIYYMNLNSPVTWQHFNDGLQSLYSYSVNAFTRIKNGFIAAALASGFFYVRPDNSSEWNERIIDSLKRPDVNSFVSFNDTIFAATDIGIFRSYDNGYSWDSVGILPMPYPVNHLIKEKNRIYACYVIKNDFYIWYSDDMGQEWIFLDHQFAFLYHLYVHQNKLWAATQFGIWYNNGEPTSVEEVNTPSGFTLNQNYPNPFNPTTKIKYTVPALSIGQAGFLPLLDKERAGVRFVSLKVYDILGNEVATLVNKEQPASEYEVVWNASNVLSGIYFYRLVIPGIYSKTMKMILLK